MRCLRRSVMFWAVVVLVGLVSWSPGAIQATTSRTLSFLNDTGQTVNDLHVEFASTVTAGTQEKVPGGGTVFTTVGGDGTKVIDFSNGSLAAGEAVRIEFSTGTRRLVVVRWWWAKDGRRVGPIHREFQGPRVHCTPRHSQIDHGESTSFLITAMAPSSLIDSIGIERVSSGIDPAGPFSPPLPTTVDTAELHLELVPDGTNWRLNVTSTAVHFRLPPVVYAIFVEASSSGKTGRGICSLVVRHPAVTGGPEHAALQALFQLMRSRFTQ